ncbi:MAG: M23 family metallopeptidase, partial [Myxococcales bacterium]|nr:M23 family metallopeptidase [Myxococcales bacterium]
YGYHLGGDYWSGGNCTDFGRQVYAAADGEIVEIVDSLGSYLDVVVIRHQVPGLGNIYSMYGHISRAGGLSEGQAVAGGQQIGTIDDVTMYFTPCHLHFEILSQAAYDSGPFCNGCQNAGFHVSPGYDKMAGVTDGVEATGDAYIEINDNIAGNRWYYTDEFIEARLGAGCGVCGDGVCEGDETEASCPQDCGGGTTDGGTTTDGGSTSDGGTGWDSSDSTTDGTSSDTSNGTGWDSSDGTGAGGSDEVAGDGSGGTDGVAYGEIADGCGCDLGPEHGRRGLPALLLLLPLLLIRRRR